METPAAISLLPLLIDTCCDYDAFPAIIRIDFQVAFPAFSPLVVETPARTCLHRRLSFSCPKFPRFPGSHGFPLLLGTAELATSPAISPSSQASERQ